MVPSHRLFRNISAAGLWLSTGAALLRSASGGLQIGCLLGDWAARGRWVMVVLSVAEVGNQYFTLLRYCLKHDLLAVRNSIDRYEIYSILNSICNNM